MVAALNTPLMVDFNPNSAATSCVGFNKDISNFAKNQTLISFFVYVLKFLSIFRIDRTKVFEFF